MREIDSQFRRSGYLGTPYHFCVKRDGVVQPGRRLNRAGTIDHPKAATSINVVIILPPDDTGTGESAKYTPEQREAAENLLRHLRAEYPKTHLEALGPVRELRQS